MRLKTMLASQKLKPHSTSKREIDDLRAVITCDLGDAVITALSAEQRFATGYNAAFRRLQSQSTALVIVHQAPVTGRRLVRRANSLTEARIALDYPNFK